MNILVAGAGSAGREVARNLSSEGFDVTLIDNDPAAIRVAAVPEATWVLGDATSEADLESAGVESADVFAALTGDDKVNLVASLIAKTDFGVPKVVARANSPGNEWLFDSTWGVDVMASFPRMVALVVERAATTSEAVQMVSSTPQGPFIYSLMVRRGSNFVGRPPSEVPVPVPLVWGAVVREGVLLERESVEVLEPEDELLLIGPDGAAAPLEELEASLG